MIVVVLGSEASGKKHLLASREDSIENASLCGALLSGAVSRGALADKSILVVIDGGKGLRRAVGESFGEYALVQRRRRSSTYLQRLASGAAFPGPSFGRQPRAASDLA